MLEKSNHHNDNGKFNIAVEPGSGARDLYRADDLLAARTEQRETLWLRQRC